MIEKSLLRQAIDKRVSRRSYLDKPLKEEVISALRTSIYSYNQEGGLAIRLVQGGKELFLGLSGVPAYLALVGKKSDKALSETLGYYGELLVLEATVLGLGTCWVGGTYKKDSCMEQMQLAADEELVCVISLGYVKESMGFKERITYKMAHHRGAGKKAEEMYVAEGLAPGWFFKGMAAVQKAPSALNKQPVVFYYRDGVVTASVENMASRQAVDLGIARLHFELGAACGGKWQKIGESYQFRL